MPALQSVRANLTRSLRDGGRGMTAGVARRRMHAALVVAEIALSLMLLIGAGLLLRSFFLLQHVEAGFQTSAIGDRDDAAVAEPRAPDASAGQSVRRARPRSATTTSLLERVRQIPGVEAAAIARSAAAESPRRGATASSSRDRTRPRRRAIPSVVDSRRSAPTTSARSAFRCCVAASSTIATRRNRRR